MGLVGGRDGRGWGFAWFVFVVVVEFYLADEFLGCGHSQVGLVLGVAAFHYFDEVDDDVRAVPGLLPGHAVQLGGGCGHVSLGAVFFFGMDSSEGSLDVVPVEVAFAFFESESCEDAGGGYLVGASVVFVSETEETHAVFDGHEDALEVADDVSSVVGFFEDDLSELWVWFSGDLQLSVMNFQLVWRTVVLRLSIEYGCS